MHDWLTGLVSTPAKDYPEFKAALSFLPALAPDDVVELLNERAQGLEFELAQMGAARTLVEAQGLPRLFWVEAEFHKVLCEAELELCEKARPRNRVRNTRRHRVVARVPRASRRGP